jgi:hypothetical protein
MAVNGIEVPENETLASPQGRSPQRKAYFDPTGRSLDDDRYGTGLIGQIKLTVELYEKLLGGSIGRLPAVAI